MSQWPLCRQPASRQGGRHKPQTSDRLFSQLGVRSQRRRWRRSSKPAPVRAYTKAAQVGIGSDLEHGAAMIHPRLGMAMRRAIKRGRVIIPGHAKYARRARPWISSMGPRRRLGPTFGSTPVLIHDAPRPHEIVLWIATQQARAPAGARVRSEESMHSSHPSPRASGSVLMPCNDE